MGINNHFMKKFILFLLIIPFFSFSQNLREISLDSYKYLVLDEVSTTQDKKVLLFNKLKNKGYNVIDIDSKYPKDLRRNPNLGLYITYEETCVHNEASNAIDALKGSYDCKAHFTLYTNEEVLVYQKGWEGVGSSLTALEKTLKPILKYNYRYKPFNNKKQSSTKSNDTEISTELNFLSEKSIRNYFDENGTELIEGIWEYSGSGSSEYRLAIVKKDYKFEAIVLERSGKFKAGDLKATLETAASDKVLSIKWRMSDKRSTKKYLGYLKNNAIIEFNLSVPWKLYRIYPKFNKNGNQKKAKTGEWTGNGSGIIISKYGYIITNHHVIDNADDIEVEFIIDDELQKFNAEIIQSDKINDLAIIKILDKNFDSLDDIQYNFQSRSSDVGTKIYTFGYPKALTGMGKEIKVTEGIISSKSGIMGDVTKYQISAPIQGGNSGGPLFDDNGNFIGINSSKFNSDETENVNYSIKSSYVMNLIDVLPKSLDLPSSTKLQSLPLTEQIKEISKYVVLVKVK